MDTRFKKRRAIRHTTARRCCLLEAAGRRNVQAPSSPQNSHGADTHSTKRRSIHHDRARRLNGLGGARFTGTACGFYSPGSSGQAQGRRCLLGRMATRGPSLRADVPWVGLPAIIILHSQPPQPTIVIPAEVAMGGHSLHEAGIHSPGLGASPQRTRGGAFHGNCLRFLLPWVLGPSPRTTMSPGADGDTGPHASGGCPLRAPPGDHHPPLPTTTAHHSHPFRSRDGRTLTPQSGDRFTGTRRVAPADPVGRACRKLLAVDCAWILGSSPRMTMI